ncbi:hypothetical protein C8R47DRAFT_1228208 [Mycena vitilis]|nr:hypothetical protein C8R47DRAFT_1228208 [Mycena vitilis]
MSSPPSPFDIPQVLHGSHPEAYKALNPTPACPQTANTSWLAVVYQKLKKLFNGKADLPAEFEMDVLGGKS